MSGATAEALWVGDGIRVRVDGVLEDLACHPDGSSTWVSWRYRTVGLGVVQQFAEAMVEVGNWMESFRQALPENERGPGWEQAVLTAIDTRRELLAAVDAHVPGWDPARPVAEVVEHLAEEAREIGEMEEGMSVANDEIAGLEVECEDLKARLAAAEDKAETYRRQGEADWNACCDVLTWAHRFAKDLPSPSRAVAAVCERVLELELTPESDPYVSRVTEFHRAMSLPVRAVPSVGTADERILRVRMLLEEVLEFAKASAIRVTVHVGHGGVLHGASDLEFEPHDADEPDLVAMTHELGDCQVIVSGCAVQLGLPLLAAVSAEIHPANMRKLGPDGRPVLRADGKVVKPEGWKPANVARVVERALAAGEVTRG